MRNTILAFILFVCSNGFSQTGWMVQQSGTSKNLRSISTYDGVNAVVVGVNGTVLTTNNIGLPWDPQPNPTVQNLNGVISITARILVTVGPKDSIYLSTNHGTSWIGVRSKVRGECYFIASVSELSAITYDSIMHTCVAVGDGQEAIFSEDSGKNWEERPSLSVTSQDFTGLKAVSSYNGKVLASGDREQTTGYSRILTSLDEGDSWTQHSTNLRGVSSFDSGLPFYGCNARAWVIVGKNGAIFHSTNQGQNWDSIPSWTTANLNAVCFADEIHGFAVGDRGVILVTVDGGYNWLPQVSPTTQNLRSVSMSNPFHGFICGDNGTILYTQDGGFTAGVNSNNRVFLNVQNYPNPFPSRTTIHIDLPQTGHINLSIYNMLGVEIAKIADAEIDAGSHTFEWNATDIPNGVYVCRLVADGKSAVSQMVVTK